MAESGYEDVVVEEDDVDEMHSRIDNNRIFGGVSSDDNVDEGVSGDTLSLPQPFDVAHEKWVKSPDIPLQQKEAFEKNSAFFGHHVTNGNILRSDNVHHMMSLEVANMYDRFPLFRQRANLIRQSDIQEHMLCRAGPEAGGFDRKMDRSVLKKEDVDARQTSTINDLRNQVRKKSGILGFLSKKKAR